MMKRSLGTKTRLGLERRLERRLTDTTPERYEIQTFARGAFTFCEVTLRLSEKKALESLTISLNTLIHKDWMPMQMLELIDARYPNLPPEARLKVLLDAIRHADSLDIYRDQTKPLRAFLAQEDTLVLEGFVRFRLKDTYEFWESCVEHAAESWLLEFETEEFLKLLRSFADIQQPRTGDVTVSATPAGDYQLMDEHGCRIEDDAFSISGAIAKEDALISLLVAVAPRRIWALGLKREAQDAISSVFGSRARFLTD